MAGFAGHVLQNTAASLVCRESVDVMAARRGDGRACGLYAEVAVLGRISVQICCCSTPAFRAPVLYCPFYSGGLTKDTMGHVRFVY